MGEGGGGGSGRASVGSANGAHSPWDHSANGHQSPNYLSRVSNANSSLIIQSSAK